MKKTLIIAAAAIALIFSVWGFFRIRSETVFKNTDILVSIPEDPFAVMRINKVDALSEDLLYNNNYWRSLSSIKVFGNIHKILSDLDSLKDISDEVRTLIKSRSLIIAAYADDSLKTSTILTSQVSANDYSLITNLLKSKGLDNKCRYVKDIFLFSDNENLLEISSKQITDKIAPMLSDSIFMKIYNTAGNNVSANLFVNIGETGKFVTPWSKQGQQVIVPPNVSGSWSGFDVDFSHDKIIIAGFGDNSSVSDINHIFDGQIAGENELVKVMPYNTVYFYHYSLSNFETFRTQLEEFNNSRAGNDSTAITENNVFQSPTGANPLVFFQEFFAGEIAYGINPMGEYVLVQLNNRMAAAERLKRYCSEMSGSITPLKDGDLDIYQLSASGFAGDIFGTPFTLKKEYMAISGGCLIIAESAKLVKYIASRNPNTQTLQCSPNYQQANLTLLSSSNLSIYADIPYLVRNASQFINTDKLPVINDNKEILSNFESLCMQDEAVSNKMNYRQFFLQYNPQIKADNPRRIVSANPPATDTIKEEAESAETLSIPSATSNELLFEATLEAPARMRPIPVTNHYTGETEFAVQDQNNNLYLIDSKGQILWKAQLTGSILGDITQVDMLKNKKLQMAFVTADKFYIIDRNGNNLSGFPKNLSNKAVAGLSVFDYENDLNYRFIYPSENNSIVLLRSDGSSPSDWKKPKTKLVPNQPVQFFRLNNKDYLLASDADNCYFFDRKGNQRLIPDHNMAKSKLNPFFVDNSYDSKRFVYSTPDGQVCFVEQNNKVNSVRLDGRSENHRFASFSKEKEIRYVFYDSNGLMIMDRDFNILCQESHLQASATPLFEYLGDKVALYDERGKRCLVYDVFSPTHPVSFTTSADFITICDVKPYRKTAVVVCDGNKIKAYGF